MTSTDRLSPAPVLPAENQTSASPVDAAKDPSATKQMFLELLVTQIKNQNPLNPADGAEFLAQLSQFTGVEQMLEMRQELEAIRGLLEGVNQPSPEPAV